MNRIYNKEYLGEVYNPTLALLLWIKYDYETEKYDNGSMASSQSNAIEWLSWMYAKIKEYDISVEEFHKAKMSKNRGDTSKEILKIYHECKKYMPWEENRSYRRGGD